MWDVLLDALLDTLKLSWILLIFYILIELVEQKIAVKMNSKLKSKYSVAVGSAFGIVPQCGFSVLASDLYSRRQITLGALLAVFIATSDEALPILLSNINEQGVWLKLLALILSKIVLALIVGYAVDIFARLAIKKSAQKEHGHESHTHDDHAHESDHVHTESHTHDDAEHDHVHEEQTAEDVDIHKGCCGHHIDDGKESNVKKYLVHPLLHTLKILAYILIINIIMGIIVYFVGEERLADFMSKSGVLQPILVTLVGLIPNCASSVIITQLFLDGTISFGACLGGLIVNAGLGIAFLFKSNKHIKENFAIVGGLFAFAVVVAITFHYIIPKF
ncbi:MAG: arsenic efflux protein [Clostridia bacterium]|nr:arsenic efflux protein [Clostridia bacterium]MDE6471598.1 arsenic efflux protein [Clostridia bacterium]